MSYSNNVIADLTNKYVSEPEFLQAATAVIRSIEPVLDAHPEYEEQALLERLVEPERVISFRVPWVDDNNKVHVNRGYRVQFNSAIGPYKGGLRFDESVNLSILKFLGFEQTFKNSLTGLPMGGGKGGSDFNPRGKSDSEIMRFCQSFMTELFRHIGPNTDVPAGDLGVGGREIGYMYGQYKRLANRWDGTFTGKGIAYGGSLARPEATGFGVAYITEHILNDLFDTDLKGKRVNISGAGNVGSHALQKATEMGAFVQTVSDINGWIYDPSGVDVDTVKHISANRLGLKKYVETHANATYTEGHDTWNIPCDIFIPCATQNELPLRGAEALVENGCKLVVEGANMPTTADATQYLRDNNVVICPGKAANAGGVSVSGLEMSQNAGHISWTFEEVDTRLQNIMSDIYNQMSLASRTYSDKTDLISGANIAGFGRVAEAMMAQGIV